MEYKTLGVMMHNRCNANCDICSVECSPYCTEELDCDDIKKFIDSCIGTTIKKISFTGGEPFLRYDVLKELVKYSKEKGFIPTTVTNGFWASSYDKAFSKMKELAECGLARINISYDHYHAKYVDVMNVKNIVIACNRLNLPFDIAIIKCNEEKIGDIVDSFGNDCGVVNFITAECEPVGNAVNRLNKDSFDKRIQTNHLCCPYNGIITLYFDGSIYPCCSHYIFGSKLKIGNFRKISMPEVLQKIRNNGLLYILRNYGFDPIIEMNPEIASNIPDRLSSPCEACKILFSENISEYVDKVINYIGKMQESKAVNE